MIGAMTGPMTGPMIGPMIGPMTGTAVPLGLQVGVLAVLGLTVGSFLNVVVHRVPAGLSVVRPGSACPQCARPVRPRDNLPVVSWLLLRGRCRDCAAPIPARYPLVEAATGLLFVLTGLRFGASAYTLAALSVVGAGVALVLIDLRHRRLPFPITAVAAAGAGAALLGETLAQGPGVLPRVAASAALWLVVYGGIWLGTAGRGMGLGDVALAPVLGLLLGWAGWGPSVVGLAAGFLLGGAVGMLLLASGRVGRGAKVAHGPFLLGGAALGLFAGEGLWQGYLAAAGLS